MQLEVALFLSYLQEFTLPCQLEDDLLMLNYSQTVHQGRYFIELICIRIEQNLNLNSLKPTRQVGSTLQALSAVFLL